MGRISDEDIQRVREANDLVALISDRVVLRQKGRLFWGLCPLHGEKSPSFKVDPATQLWHCFGCGKGGDVFGFVMETDNVDFPDAVRLLADRARIEISEDTGPAGASRGRKERLMAACEAAAEFYARHLTGSHDAGAAKAREYLGGRGFGSQVAKEWRLGFAPGRGALTRHLREQGFSADEMVDANLALRTDGGAVRDRFYERVMFPISDLQGRVIAFGGRVIGSGEPKYLNTSDTPIFRKSTNMYAIDRARGAITADGTALVVEGYTDVIALHKAGITNAVATLGTALTQQHVKLLGRFARRIVYLFDGDEAGMRAADRAAEFIDSYSTEMHDRFRVDLSAAVIPGGMDPADLVEAEGADALRALVAGAVPLLQFSIDRRLARWDLDRPEERARALRDAAEVLAPVKGSLLAADYANYIADKLLADTVTVQRAIDAARPTPGRTEEAAPADEREHPAVGEEELLPVRVRIERELLGVLNSYAQLRGKARELLDSNLLSDERHRGIAEVFAQAGPAVQGNALNGLLEARVPGAVRMLAGVRLMEDAADPDALAESMIVRLKEFELQRRIAAGRARLRNSGEFTSAAEYDEVFREVSLLQRELDAVRRGEHNEDDRLEAQY